MALTTFGGLKTSVASWLHRSDLTSVIPDFVALAEADLSRDLRIQAMESVATGTLTGETLAFPTRFLEARRVVIDECVYRFEPPDVYAEMVRTDRTDYVYTIQGQNFYILNGASGDDYTLTYYAMFAGLSDDADTNWLLTNHPDTYLFGSLKNACVYIADDAGMQRYTAMYERAVARVKTGDRKAAYGKPTVRPDNAYTFAP